MLYVELTYSDNFHLQCNRTVALDAFFKQILQEPVKISWIGSGCSVATEPTAEISHYYNITQVIQQVKLCVVLEGWKSPIPFTHILPIQFSCVSSSTELVNRERFRYYFQMLATEAELAIDFFGVIKHFGWRRVAFIEQDENLFTVVSSHGAVNGAHFLHVTDSPT